MSYRVKKYQETPNPNALKCILDRSAGGSMRSFLNAAAAAGDPLGSAIFNLKGVTNVLINGDWITVSKSPDAAWREIKPGLERVLAEAV